MSQVAPANGGKDIELGPFKPGKPNKPNLAAGNPLSKKVISKEKKEKADKFDEFYRSLGAKIKPEEKRIDYVLVHDLPNPKEEKDEEEQKEYARIEMLREKFEEAMKEEGLQKQKVQIDGRVYTKVHCPFKRLAIEAEQVSLQMPLQGVCIFNPLPDMPVLGSSNSAANKDMMLKI